MKKTAIRILYACIPILTTISVLLSGDVKMVWIGYIYIIVTRTITMSKMEENKYLIVLQDIMLYLIPNLILLFIKFALIKPEIGLFVWFFSGYLLFSILCLLSCVVSTLLLKIMKRKGER